MDEVTWKKSSYSAYNGSCVEMAWRKPGEVLVRDSKNPQGAVLTFTPAGWAAFLAGVRGVTAR